MVNCVIGHGKTDVEAALIMMHVCQWCALPTTRVQKALVGYGMGCGFLDSCG